MDRRVIGAITVTAAAGAALTAGASAAVGALAVGVGAFFLLGRSSGHPVALNPDMKIPFKLIWKEQVSHDTVRLRYALQSPQHILGLPIGKHMDFSAQINGKQNIKAYTPVSSDDDIGIFELVVKVYRPLEPKFPNGGLMSQHLGDMKVGETIDVRGPTGHIEYAAPGTLRLWNKLKKREAPRTVKVTHLAMIAGGTGITPMLQIVRHILKTPGDKTKMSLIFANKSEDDILLREELEACAKDPRFNLWFTIDNSVKEGWQYDLGFITEEMIRKQLPAPGDGVHVLMCGPPPMIKFACKPNLEKIGFGPENMSEF